MSKVPLFILNGRLRGRWGSFHLDSVYRFSLYRKKNTEGGGTGGIPLLNAVRMWLDFTFRETQKLSCFRFCSLFITSIKSPRFSTYSVQERNWRDPNHIFWISGMLQYGDSQIFQTFVDLLIIVSYISTLMKMLCI